MDTLAAALCPNRLIIYSVLDRYLETHYIHLFSYGLLKVCTLAAAFCLQTKGVKKLGKDMYNCFYV